MTVLNMIASSSWLPEQASTFAEETDFLFNAILAISVVSFVGIVIAMILFTIWYRRRDGYVPKPAPAHSTLLELIWTIVPSIILVWIFAVGASGYADLKTPKNNAPIIDVTAFQFGWRFTYPTGEVSDTLHLSAEQPVQLRLKSDDVIHSFYVPEFRAKMDVMPRRYHSIWFQPTKTGTFHLYCTEYCGDGHSLMKRDVVVHEEPWDQMMDKYVKWRENEHPALINGERLYKIHCSGCHSYDGKDMTGPTFYGFVSRTHEFSNADPITFSGPEDDQLRTYVTESILEPAAKIVAGRTNQMPNFNGKLSPSQIEALIAFILEVDDGSYSAPVDEPPAASGAASGSTSEPAETTTEEETTEPTASDDGQADVEASGDGDAGDQ